MNGINQFVFNKIMSQYLVFKFQRFIELDFKIEYKVSEPVFCNTGSSSEKKNYSRAQELSYIIFEVDTLVYERLRNSAEERQFHFVDSYFFFIT